jgi:hypothetical protein
LQDLKDDLLAADDAGVTWKFILLPEPIQNLGPFVPQDRFEGYAYERTELLQFIDDNNLANVVFIAADVHGTLVNNLTYQTGPGQPQIPMAAFEITTGPVAFDAPFGPTVFQFAEDYGFVSPLLGFLYDLAGRRGKDGFILAAGNALISDFGYDPIGLDDSPIDAELLVGRYVSVNAYGWTEFDVDADTQQLTVTTYGIDWYTEDELLAQPWRVSNRPPRIFSQFVVYPAPGDGG